MEGLMITQITQLQKANERINQENQELETEIKLMK